MTRPSLRRAAVGGSLVVIALVAASCGSGSSETTPDSSAQQRRSTSSSTAAPIVTEMPDSGAQVSTSAPNEDPVLAEILVDNDVPYYEAEDGRVHLMDVYYPLSGDGLPLVVVYHGNPVFGQSKSSVETLARAIAEQGAVVVAPTWGSRMAMDMFAIAEAVVTWNRDHASCAVWAALDLSASHGADREQLIVVGVTTGVLPGQAVTFGAAVGEVPGCEAPPAEFTVERAILFDADWLLVPSIWDEVLVDDPGFLKTASYWEAAVGEPSQTEVRMLVGETEAGDTVRALDAPYEESQWISMRDPQAKYAADFAALGGLEDGSMSFADVTRVVVRLLTGAGWDAEVVEVPGAGHSLSSTTAIEFVADMVLADM